jgi:hypothetical protein
MLQRTVLIVHLNVIAGILSIVIASEAKQSCAVMRVNKIATPCRLAMTRYKGGLAMTKQRMGTQ